MKILIFIWSKIFISIIFHSPFRLKISFKYLCYRLYCFHLKCVEINFHWGDIISVYIMYIVNSVVWQTAARTILTAVKLFPYRYATFPRFTTCPYSFTHLPGGSFYIPIYTSFIIFYFKHCEWRWLSFTVGGNGDCIRCDMQIISGLHCIVHQICMLGLIWPQAYNT